jgi:hypothetical protein
MSADRIISIVQDVSSTATRQVSVQGIINAVKRGRWRQSVERIRHVYQETLKKTGSHEEAKKAVDRKKKALPGVTWSGTFRNRERPVPDKLIAHSGLLCADLDQLNAKLWDVREKLLKSPHLWALFLSPTATGLKAIFRIPAEKLQHQASFRAVKQHVLELAGVQIDESGKDVGRLCIVSYDLEAGINLNAREIAPLPEPEKPLRVQSNATVNLSERQRIAVELLGEIRWDSETYGFGTCPGKRLHTSSNAWRDCEIYLDGAPTVYCFHNSCSGIVAGVNHELRSRIGKTEYANTAAGNGSNDEKIPIRKSAATQLVEFANDFAFFHDPQDRSFVRMQINGHTEVWPVESSRFRKLLARLYYKRTRKAVNRNALADAIATLAGRACHDSPEEPVFLRVAPQGENILIDICDERWRVIEVTQSGWRVVDKSPVAFVRTGSMQALPEPVRGGSIDPLWDLLNVTKAQRPLVAGALLNAFHPHGPYFVTIYVGEQGTAKSCAARIQRQLVDPNENPLRSPPKEERDLMAQAAGNRCVALDNLSSLPPWLSDALCRLATGGGHSARALYTDLEEISLAVKRPVILNGIEDVATRPDLAERVLQIELETIGDPRRISEKDLWRKFDEQRSVIFSGLLDALVCALHELPSIILYSLPRMADAALWATAGETAFGWERGTFIAAYKQNLNEGAIASVEAHPIGVAIRQLLEKQPEWSGEPTQLLQTLNGLITEEQRHAQNWPQNVRSLGHCLRRLAPALRSAGIGYERDKGTRRTIHLCNAREKTSETSASSANCAEKDVQDVPDDVLPPLHVSTMPPEAVDL